MDPITQSKFLSLYCMILADGIVDAAELEVLYRIARENYNLSAEEVTEAVRDAGSSFYTPELLEDKIELLYQMAEIAWADGVIEESERHLLNKYALRFGFEPENVEGITDFLLARAEKKIPLADVLTEIRKN